MSSKALKLALLGLGKMGQNHLKILAKLSGVKIACIYDYDALLAQNLAKEYNLNYAKTPKELKNFLKIVDAVIIATPTFTHYEYIKLASKYVKNIFVEKPLCASFTEGEKIKKLAKKLGLKIQTGFIERYNPSVLELQKNLAGKSPRMMEFRRSSLGSSRIKDADVISDLMIHDIDLALHLNGAGKCVFACGVKSEQIDLAKAIIKHENGMFSSIFASRITHKNQRQISVDCADCFISCDLMAKKLYLNESELEVKSLDQLNAELEGFLALCNNEIESQKLADYKAGIKALKIADDIRNIINKD